MQQQCSFYLRWTLLIPFIVMETNQLRLYSLKTLFTLFHQTLLPQLAVAPALLGPLQDP